MTLREGRASLHDRLNAAAHEANNIAGRLWTRRELCDLLAQARDAILKCPHVDCAYCYQVERKEQG